MGNVVTAIINQSYIYYYQLQKSVTTLLPLTKTAKLNLLPPVTTLPPFLYEFVTTVTTIKGLCYHFFVSYKSKLRVTTVTTVTTIFIYPLSFWGFRR